MYFLIVFSFGACECSIHVIITTSNATGNASVNLGQSWTISDGVTWNRNPPTPPPKSMLKSREEKNVPFCILDLVGGGRGGLSVPFKKSEIVGLKMNLTIRVS